MSIASFRELSETTVKIFAESPLGKMSEGKVFDDPISQYDIPLGRLYIKDVIGEKADDNEEETAHLNCPRENGYWEGGDENRGEGKWIPDRDYVPLDNGKGNNPEGKSMGEIMDKYGIDGIRYENGEPDFSEVRHGEPVEIKEFSDDRKSNFDQADAAYAERHNRDHPDEPMTPEDVKNYRKENGLTWHERRDCATMEMVPIEIHGNCSHRGGIAEYKERSGA